MPLIAFARWHVLAGCEQASHRFYNVSLSFKLDATPVRGGVCHVVIQRQYKTSDVSGD